MASQTFRLHAVARLRESNRDQLRGRYAEALRAQEVLEEQRGEVLAMIASLSEERRESVAVGTIDVVNLLSIQRYELALRTKQHEIEDNLKKVGEEADRRRLALVEAEREVRAMDKLRERSEKRERARQEQLRARELDEFASVTHRARKKETGANA